MTITISAERRKRLKLKRIVVSEQKYLALKKPRHTGDSFNDVFRSYYEYTGTIKRSKNKRVMMTAVGGFLPESLSELFERDRQQLDEFLRLRKRGSTNNQTSEQVIGK